MLKLFDSDEANERAANVLFVIGAIAPFIGMAWVLFF